MKSSGLKILTVSFMRRVRTRLTGSTGREDSYIDSPVTKDSAAYTCNARGREKTGSSLIPFQMPLNVMDAHYRSFEKLVLPELVKQQIGVLGMKSMANGILLKSKTVTPIECLHYALSLPTSVVIAGIDSMEILTSIAAVESFHR